MSAATPVPNPDFIMDIPVELSIELGRSRIQVRDAMSLAPGIVVQLDRKNEDPVDLYVNGQLVARGEIIQQEGSVGIKVTEVVAHKSAN